MVETIRHNKTKAFVDGPSVFEIFQKEEDGSNETSDLNQEEFNYIEAEPSRTTGRRRGRPRVYPYSNEKYSHFSSALDMYNTRSNKDGYVYNPTNDDSNNLEDSKVNEKEEESYLKDNYDELIESYKQKEDVDSNLKDKNETDTRLTSSSEVLSNFNYETIDNYEVSDNYETIDNYTMSQDYTASLNDNCEFPLKSNDSEFNLDETNLETITSHTFNSCNDDEFLMATDDVLDKDQDLSTSKDYDSLVEKSESCTDLTSELETSKLSEQEFSDKKGLDSESMFVISDELRQSYIRQSKLLPKIRGVWFNSTVRRMGWVGQAYKKCKRIEKIFSINKHGFEGARKLAIAFRNSQKPNNKSEVMSYPDVSLKDVLKPISQLRLNLTRQKDRSSSTKDQTTSTKEYSKEFSKDTSKSTNKENLDKKYKYNEKLELLEKDKVEDETYSKDRLEYELSRKDKENRDKQWSNDPIDLNTLNNGEEKEIDDSAYPVDYKEIIDKYKSSFNNEEKIVRDNTCREALLFMLYELAALVELDFPVPPVSKVDCKRGIKYHINFLENSKQSIDMLPYINSLAHYICKGITPTDMAHFELYSLIHTLSHCQPLKMKF